MTAAELKDLFDILDELAERMARIETRLVKLMLAQGVNPHTGSYLTKTQIKSKVLDNETR